MHDVPFYANTPDDSRCVHACFRMVLKHFLPRRSYTWKQLDTLLSAEPSKGTWWFPGLLAMKKLGIETIMISPLDYRALSREGIAYLSRVMSSKTVTWYRKNSNLVDVIDTLPEFIRSNIWKYRNASWRDVDTLLEGDYLVGIEINAKTLNGQRGLSPHMIIIFQKTSKGYILHDPGLPPVPNRLVAKTLLSRAWNFDKKGTSLVAFRRKGVTERDSIR